MESSIRKLFLLALSPITFCLIVIFFSLKLVANLLTIIVWPFLNECERKEWIDTYNKIENINSD